jgi:hypothetical protein
MQYSFQTLTKRWFQVMPALSLQLAKIMAPMPAQFLSLSTQMTAQISKSDTVKMLDCALYPNFATESFT